MKWIRNITIFLVVTILLTVGLSTVVWADDSSSMQSSIVSAGSEVQTAAGGSDVLFYLSIGLIFLLGIGLIGMMAYISWKGRR